jgi:hypothetical protein
MKAQNALMATKNLEGDFEKMKYNLPRITEVFTMRLIKSNEYTDKWEQIFKFLETRCGKVDDSVDSEDEEVTTLKSCWTSFRLIDEETK